MAPPARSGLIEMYERDKMEIAYRVNAEIKAADLQRLFRQTSWASGRSLEGIGRMLTHTYIHVSAWEGGMLVGFARGVTDMVYRAVVDDVVVEEAYRGRGIGEQLMNRLGAELSEVEEVFLGCGPGVVRFYEKQGYTQANHPFMKRVNRRADKGL